MLNITRYTCDSISESPVAQRYCHEPGRAPTQPPPNSVAMRRQRASSGMSLTVPIPPNAGDREHLIHSDYQQPQRSSHDGLRRVTTALTAREVYDSAVDPLLVPKPLTLRTQARNLSAPAALQTTCSSFLPLQPLQLGAVQHTNQLTFFRDRTHSEQDDLLDIATRVIASGFEAAEIASLMGLDLEELTQHIACFAVAVREGPIFVGDEAYTFSRPGPTSCSSERYGEYNDSIIEDAQNDIIVGWEENLVDQESMIAHHSSVTGESLEEEVVMIARREYNDQEEAVHDTGQQIVYHTTSENWDGVLLSHE